MNCFVIVSPDKKFDPSLVTQAFRDHSQVSDDVWVVAGEQGTCADVCDKLGIGTPTGTRGVVVKLDDYYGFFDRALWEKINEWRSRT